jgi:hypothetical protein
LAGEVVSCLSHLLTVEEINALVRCAGAGENEEKQKMCASALESVFNRVGLTEGEYPRKSSGEKQALIDGAINALGVYGDPKDFEFLLGVKK